MKRENTPVLIVGGGGAGLTSSMLLSTLGVDSLLVSSLPHTTKLPKAHVLNQRTMEIFTEVGVADEVYRRGIPAENFVASSFHVGVAGPHADYGREVGRLELWGAGYTDPAYIAASPCRHTNLPQIRLEPILKRRAEELNPAGVRFDNHLVSITQNAESVVSVIRDNATGEEYEVESAYVIGADAGRTVGKAVGIELEGERDILNMVSVHMTADLSSVLEDDSLFLRWIISPEFGSTFEGGVLVAMGPDNWGTRSEEWVVHFAYPFGDPDAGDVDKVTQRMRETFGLPDLDPTIHAVSLWTMEGVLADQYRSGRVFVVGDAAHRHPPTGGLGLNSAVHDVQNLCWKLAQVIQGTAGDALLDSYHDERRPVAARNIQNSVDCTMARFRLDKALGISPEQSTDENWRQLRILWDESDAEHAERTDLVTNALAAQSLEFRHHNLEFGYTYLSSAVVPDGTPAPVEVDAVRLYRPDARPGHPLPHAFVDRRGETRALGELTHGGHFVLLAGEDGSDWVEAANAVARATGVKLRAFTVGADDSDLVDVRFAWLQNRGISRSGAVLVRPDRFVAFRSQGGEADPERVILETLRAVLSNPDLTVGHPARSDRVFA